MNNYSNTPYGFTAPRSTFRSHQPEPIQAEQTEEIKPKKKEYLPGERLLKKLDKVEKKKKALDMGVIHKSINDILRGLLIQD